MEKKENRPRPVTPVTEAPGVVMSVGAGRAEEIAEKAQQWQKPDKPSTTKGADA